MDDPKEALIKANIDRSFLAKLKSYINSPMAKFIIPMVGLNKQTALQKLNELERELDDTPEDSQPSSSGSKGFTDDLDKYKKGLKSFK